MSFEQGVDDLGRYVRVIADSDHDIEVRSQGFKLWPGLDQGMPRSFLFGLEDVFRFAPELGFDLFSLVADDDEYSADARRPDGLDLVADHGLAQDGQEDLVRSRPHPRAPARGQDDRNRT